MVFHVLKVLFSYFCFSNFFFTEYFYFVCNQMSAASVRYGPGVTQEVGMVRMNQK